MVEQSAYCGSTKSKKLIVIRAGYKFFCGNAIGAEELIVSLVFRLVTSAVSCCWGIAFHATSSCFYLWNITFEYISKRVKVFLLLIPNAVKEIL